MRFFGLRPQNDISFCNRFEINALLDARACAEVAVRTNAPRIQASAFPGKPACPPSGPPCQTAAERATLQVNIVSSEASKPRASISLIDLIANAASGKSASPPHAPLPKPRHRRKAPHNAHTECGFRTDRFTGHYQPGGLVFSNCA